VWIGVSTLYTNLIAKGVILYQSRGHATAKKAKIIVSGNPIRYQSKVLELKQISASGYELIIERCDMPFMAGKEIMLHGHQPTDDRQYSIASSEQSEHIHVLFRLIEEGVMTPKLVAKKAGDPIEFTGPFGSFVLRDFLTPIVFIATGTGIAPAVSFVDTHPGLDFTLLHGVRMAEDLFYKDRFTDCGYVPCLSKEKDTGCFEGRVTDYLKDTSFPEEAHYYLCGANDMILEVRRILKDRGVNDNAIFSEAYYFW